MINYQDLPVCLDSGAKKVLLPSASMREIGSVPDDLAAAFDFISYRSAEEAVFKALGVDCRIGSEWKREVDRTITVERCYD